MAAKIEETLGLEVELVRGSKGIFDVHAGGECIFSKHQTGRFPDEEEILEALRARMG